MFNIGKVATPFYLARKGPGYIKRLQKADCMVQEAISIMAENQQKDEETLVMVWLLMCGYLHHNGLPDDLNHFEILAPAPDGEPFDRDESNELFEMLKHK